MSPRRLITFVFLVVVFSSTQANAKTVIVRFVNGKNGKPARDRNINVWFGEQGPSLWPTGDPNGEIRLEISDDRNAPTEIRVMPNYFFDCRFRRDESGGSSVKYSIAEIMSEGFVGENLCGRITATPTPGVLILFVRRRSFLELWRL